MKPIRAPIRDMPKHGDALMWLNRLIMDLKLQLAGLPPIDPITAERLAEGERHYDELERCRERTVVY